MSDRDVAIDILVLKPRVALTPGELDELKNYIKDQMEGHVVFVPNYVDVYVVNSDRPIIIVGGETGVQA